MYHFSENTIIKKNENKVILGNARNGQWIRISEPEYANLCGVLQEQTLDQAYTKKIAVLKRAGILVENGTEEDAPDRLEAIMIAITNRCNLRCLHCGFSAGPEEKEQLSFEEVRGIIDANRNIESITLTGGEPLIHPRFSDIADYLGRHFVGAKGLMTNATLIDHDKIDLVVHNFDSVYISLDAATRETCDLMRGAGVFEHTIGVVRQLKKRGLTDISISFVITEINRNEQELFKKLCEDLDVKPTFRKLLSVGRGKENENRLALKQVSDESDEAETERIAEIRKKAQIKNRCGAASRSLYIQYDGNIYPCPVAAVDPEFAMRHISELANGNLQMLIDGREACSGYCKFCSILPDRIEPCAGCKVRDFCWGCIQDYFTYFNNKKLKMEFCIQRKELLEKAIWGD